MSARLLILTAGFGEGHNAAARAIAAACERQHGPSSALIVDAFALASPRTNAVLRRGYLAMINGTPRLWSAVYAWMDRSNIFPSALMFLRQETRVLAQIIAREKPTVICSTYPVYAFILEKLAHDARCDVPNFNIVTDSISINSLWWRVPCTGWFLPNADSADVLLQAGIEADRLHISGFPVTPFFSDHVDEFAPTNLSTGAVPRVLYIINSGTQNAETTARKLLAEQGWEITCAVGRDEVLKRSLMRLAAGRARPAQILGWTNQIPQLLMTHHVVVSKAGGATTQEAIAARCPMIVNQVVPGQEEGNYELLRRHGIGALAETPDAVIRTLRNAFEDRGRVWQQWRAALQPLVRPDAARVIVDHLLPSPLPSGDPATCRLTSDTLLERESVPGLTPPRVAS
jgi:processive 1,2-diacylglycerol beta-glucosyltransferase